MRWPLLIFLLLGGAGAEAAKGKPPKLERVKAASGVIPVPGGLVTVGGAKLRHLPDGQKKWVTLHTVKGDNLYRVAGDEQGRLLASWEQEDRFHLFVPGKKKTEHRTFAKPPSPGKPYITWSVDEIYFDQGGQHAIVYMGGYTGGTSSGVVAYRYPLDGKSAPTELFRQSGHQLHTSARLTAFMWQKDPSRSCDANGCDVAAIVAWEITDSGASKQVLLDASKSHYTDASLVWGSDGDRLAIVLEQPKKAGRKLLRWRRGDKQATLQAIPAAPRWRPDGLRLTAAGDVIELWVPDDRSLEIWRFPTKGKRQVTRFAPLAQTDPEERPLFGVYGLKERKNGDLLIHWGDYIYLVPGEGGEARRLWLEPLLGKHNEWAGAFIYVAEPETLWIGIEGGGRSFVLLPLAELERLAEPVAATAPAP